MENKSHALMTGIFTLLLLIATIWGGIWFNRDRTERIPYLLTSSQAISGLNPQAPVRYKGLMVGRVKSIGFDRKKSGQILIEIGINPETPITASSFATLGYQGVTGIAFVQLDDDGSKPELLRSSAANMAHIPLRPGMLAQLEQNAKKILQQSEELSRRANALLALENQQKLFATVEKIGQAAEKFGAIPSQLEPSLARLPALASAAEKSLQSVNKLSQDASVLAGNINQVALRLQASDGPVHKLGKGIDQVSSLASDVELEALPRINALTDEARSSVRAFNKGITNISERPQSLLFGAPVIVPGPGETGFAPPASAAASPSAH